jgi:uncharacterized protein YchJ
MTLVVGAQNNDYALQVSDRRLTAEDGLVVDDESNKLFVFESDACRFVVGYSGLARFSGPGSFETKDWLSTILRDSAPPDFNPDAIVERLRLAATRQFKMKGVRRLPSSARLLSIMLNGFVYTKGGPLAAYCMITNYQDYERGKDNTEPWPEFRMLWHILRNPPRPAWNVQRIGFWKAFGTKQLEAVRSLVREGRPAKAVVAKTVELIREISGPPGTGNTVGRQLMSAVMTVNAAQGSQFAYHTDVEQSTYHMPAVIFAKSDIGGVIFRDATLTAVAPDGQPAAVGYPKQPRNQLCACGSGKKYKRCHGAHG